MRAVLLLAFGAGLVLCSSCKKKKVFEHVVQRQASERAFEARRAAMKKAARPLVYESWPAPVQQRYLELMTAQRQDVPSATRALAELGPDAVPALRDIATGPSQAQDKRALSSLLLVELQMAKPPALEALAVDPSLPFAQRAALDSLVRLGRPEGERVLQRVETELRKRFAGSAMLARLADSRRREKHPWDYSASQLQRLDRVLVARQREEVEAALDSIKDLSLQAGLERLLRSAVVPMPIQAMIAGRMVQISTGKGQLEELLSPAHPPMLRLAAARALILRGRSADRELVRRMARSKNDPLAPGLQHLIDARQTPPTE